MANKLPKGFSKTRLYRTYHDMIARCYRPTAQKYKYYGAKGITVCEEWRESYQTFYEWAVQSGYKEGLQIDRIDNSKGYCPENCRWADKVTQENNKTTNRWVDLNGETHTLAEWARIYPIKPATLRQRLNKGWSPELALTAELGHREPKQKKETERNLMWLSPNDIQTHNSIKRSTAYQLLKEYEESGGEVIRIGKLRRVPEEAFTNFLRGRNENH